MAVPSLVAQLTDELPETRTTALKASACRARVAQLVMHEMLKGEAWTVHVAPQHITMTAASQPDRALSLPFLSKGWEGLDMTVRYG
jgi:hypothetical protein